MRNLEGILVLILVPLLWMLPVAEAIYNFRTNVREDTVHVITTSGQTTASIVLIRPIYQEDSETIAISSNCSSDLPVIEMYIAATRVISISGLAENESHLLVISYDVDALSTHSAVNTFLNWLPTLWVLILFIFPTVVIYVVIRNRHR